MDRAAFDALTRRLATPGSRRAVLGALAGALLVSSPATAHRRHRRRTRPDTPGNGGVPPGHGGTPPGHGGTPPGLGGTPPGHGGTPPGQGGTPPGAGGGCKASGQVCGGIFGDCCASLTCTPTLAGVGTCEFPCANDAQCAAHFPNNESTCQADALACPFIEGAKCCVPRVCHRTDQCSTGFQCIGGLCRR